MSIRHELALVGGGNMGAAMLDGWLAAGVVDVEGLVVVEVLDERRTQLADRHRSLTVVEAVPEARAAVLAVKPDGIAAAARTAVERGARRLLSIAAGVSTATIRRAIADVDGRPDGRRVAVIRAMPNTPALVGQGVAAVCGDEHSTDADLAWAEELLRALGTVVRLPESKFDAVTALTGSGPAYVFLVAEALVEAGVHQGLPRDQATTMVQQLLVGSSALLADRGDPATLRAMVTSPGGTTAAGLRQLEERGVRAALMAAVEAAALRSRELDDA